MYVESRGWHWVSSFITLHLTEPGMKGWLDLLASKLWGSMWLLPHHGKVSSGFNNYRWQQWLFLIQAAKWGIISYRTLKEIAGRNRQEGSRLPEITPCSMIWWWCWPTFEVFISHCPHLSSSVLVNSLQTKETRNCLAVLDEDGMMISLGKCPDWRTAAIYTFV